VVGGRTNTYTALFTNAVTVLIRSEPPAAGKLTLSPVPVEGGALSNGVKYARGTTVRVTAAAQKGWKFVRWSDGATTPARSFAALTTNVTLTAVYGLPTPASVPSSALAAAPSVLAKAAAFVISAVTAPADALVVHLDGMTVPAGLKPGTELLTVVMRGGQAVLEAAPLDEAGLSKVSWKGSLRVDGSDVSGHGLPAALEAALKSRLADGTVLLRVCFKDGVLVAETPLPDALVVQPVATAAGPWPVEWRMYPAAK
jgi:hypothetical protein